MAIVAALVAGLAMRLVGLSQVLTPSGVRFTADSDPHYHVLQAERLLAGGLSAAWYDRSINWPHGADIPWPPLFDVVIAAATRVIFGPVATRPELEQVSAVIPVVLGLVTLVFVAGLASSLLETARAGPAFLVALLSSHVAYSAIGRADQHVAEILFSCWVAWSFVRTWQPPAARRRTMAAVVMGLGVALSFWNWMGSALNLVLPVAFTGAAHVLLRDRPEISRRVESGLSLGLATATAVLAATIAAWGPPGALRRGELLGITGLQVALTACGATFAAVLLAVTSTRRSNAGAARAVAEVGVAALLPAAVALAIAPSLREGVRAGLTALGAGNPWYAEISEFRPLLFSCHLPLSRDLALLLGLYGLSIPAACLAIPPLARRWREPAARPSVLFVASWGLLFFALALLRKRFAPYFTIPLALLAWEGLLHAIRAGTARWPRRPGWIDPALTALGAAAIVAPTVPYALDVRQVPEARIEAMRWLATRPGRSGGEGVLASWELGHLALYYSGKPVVVTPFGTEGGTGAMEYAARFDLAPDATTAEALARARRIGFVVLTDPVVGAHMEAALARPSTPVRVQRECTMSAGKTDSVGPEYLDLAAPRLYYFDGLAPRGRPTAPMDAFRLVYETPAAPGEPQRQVKTFELVAGSRVLVSGARPSLPVQATVSVTTNQGRRLVWSTWGVADSRGKARLRLPYATGWNGATFAMPWKVTDGARVAEFVVTGDAVESGAAAEIDLGRVGSSDEDPLPP